MPRIEYNYVGTKVKMLMELRIAEAEEMGELIIRNAEREMAKQRARGISERQARANVLTDFDNGDGLFRDMDRQINQMVDELYKDAVTQPVDHYAEENQNQLFLWKLGKVKTDHCPDCRYLSTLPARNIKSWKNIAIGGRKVGLPRQGKTKCSYGCKCLLQPVGEKEAPVQEEKIKKEKGTKGIDKDQLSPGMVGKHTTVAEAEAWATHNFKRTDGKPLAVDYSGMNDPALANKFNTTLKQLYKDFPANDLQNILVGGVRESWYGMNRGGREITMNEKYMNANRKKMDKHYETDTKRRFHPLVHEAGKLGFRASILTHEFGHTLGWKYIRTKNSYWSQNPPIWAEGMATKLRSLQRKYNKDVKAFNKRWGNPQIYKTDPKNQSPEIREALKNAGTDHQGNYYAPYSFGWHKNNKIRTPLKEGQVVPPGRAYLTQKEVNQFLKERDAFFVSGYAKKNLDEFISECVAMYYHGIVVSPYATKVWQVLKDAHDQRMTLDPGALANL